MKITTTWTMGAGTAILVLSLLAVLLFSACQREPAVAPATPGTSVDDNGGGGNGSDDPPGDDNGGGN